MTYRDRQILCILIVGLLNLTGCFSLSRDEPPLRHYVLGGSALEDRGAQEGRLDGLTIGLRQPQVSAYLQSELIAVRLGTHQIHLSEFNRWGEDLGGGINRALAGYLTARASFAGVDRVPWSPLAKHDYLIQLQVLRFEGVTQEGPTVTEGEAHLLATWEIVNPRDGVVLARGTTDYQGANWRVGDYDGLVGLLNAGLGKLSEDLIASLESIAVQ